MGVRRYPRVRFVVAKESLKAATTRERVNTPRYRGHEVSPLISEFENLCRGEKAVRVK